MNIGVEIDRKILSQELKKFLVVLFVGKGVKIFYIG